MSVENGSSEMGASQPMVAGRKLLPPITPGGAPAFVSEKQYDAIIRLREHRRRVQEPRQRNALKVKKCPPRGYRGRFVSTKDKQEGTDGGIMVPSSATGENDENIGVPISNPAGDIYRPVVASNDEEENIGEVAYNSILNLESPDPTMLLRIMMGNRYSTDQVSEQFQNLARLQAPDFATLLTIMNNAGYDEAVDDGHYDVNKVMTRLQGW